MKPVLGVKNVFELENDDCLVDEQDKELVISAPSVVREIPLGGGLTEYKTTEFSVKVRARSIYEAVRKCRPEA